jgi:hypothetical protein
MPQTHTSEDFFRNDRVTAVGDFLRPERWKTYIAREAAAGPPRLLLFLFLRSAAEALAKRRTLVSTRNDWPR